MVFRLSLWVLFYAHGLRSPAALQKLLHRFSAAYTLIQRIAKQKIRRKIFAAAARRRVYMASAASLKNHSTILEPNIKINSLKF